MELLHWRKAYRYQRSKEGRAGACNEIRSSHFLGELKLGPLANYRGSLPLPGALIGEAMATFNRSTQSLPLAMLLWTLGDGEGHGASKSLYILFTLLARPSKKWQSARVSLEMEDTVSFSPRCKTTPWKTVLWARLYWSNSSLYSFYAFSMVLCAQVLCWRLCDDWRTEEEGERERRRRRSCCWGWLGIVWCNLFCNEDGLSDLDYSL